jgi:hypothetical protein
MNASRNAVFTTIFITLLLGNYLNAAVPVEGLTPEKIGLKAEEFVPLELAKKAARHEFLGYFPDGDEENIKYLVFPWVIEGLDVFEPPLKTAYYEIGVYASDKTITFESYVKEVDALSADAPDLEYADGVWNWPSVQGGIERNGLQSFLKTSAIIDCYVSVNRNTPWSTRSVTLFRFAENTYFYGIADEIAEAATGVSGWEYEGSFLANSYGYISVRRGDEKRIIGFGPYYGKGPYVFTQEGFENYVRSQHTKWPIERKPGDPQVPFNFDALD